MPFKHQFSVRSSKRAKRVLLNFTPFGLEIVVPVDYDRSQLPSILESKASWIQAQLERRKQRVLLRPRSINLRAVRQVWRCIYVASGSRFRVSETAENRRLVIEGPVDDRVRVAKILNLWVQRQARTHLSRWLDGLSQDYSLQYENFSVRRFKTLWGSCSASQAIVLNRNLLFLPPRLVRYVLVHELCHTREQNHGTGFCLLFAAFEPENLRPAFIDAEKLIPLWASFG